MTRCISENVVPRIARSQSPTMIIGVIPFCIILIAFLCLSIYQTRLQASITPTSASVEVELIQWYADTSLQHLTQCCYHPSGLKYEDLQVVMSYIKRRYHHCKLYRLLEDGTVFDSSITRGQTIDFVMVLGMSLQAGMRRGWHAGKRYTSAGDPFWVGIWLLREWLNSCQFNPDIRSTSCCN